MFAGHRVEGHVGRLAGREDHVADRDGDAVPYPRPPEDAPVGRVHGLDLPIPGFEQDTSAGGRRHGAVPLVPPRDLLWILPLERESATERLAVDIRLADSRVQSVGVDDWLSGEVLPEVRDFADGCARTWRPAVGRADSFDGRPPGGPGPRHLLDQGVPVVRMSRRQQPVNTPDYVGTAPSVTPRRARASPARRPIGTHI